MMMHDVDNVHFVKDVTPLAALPAQVHWVWSQLVI